MSINIREELKAAEVEVSNHNYDKALELARILLQELDRPQNTTEEKQRISVLSMIADISNLKGNWADGLIYLNMIKNMGLYNSSLPIRVETILRVADIYANTGKWDNALANYDETVKMVQNFHNPKLMAQALAGKSVVFWRTGHNNFSINFGKQALKLAREISDDELIGKSAAVLSNAWSECNEYKKSLDASVEAEEAYRRMGNRFDISRVLSNRGEIHKVLGEYEEGIKVFEKAIAENKDWDYDNAFLKSLILINLAICQIKVGKLDEAEKTAIKADESLIDSEDKYAIAFNNALKGMVASEKGNHDDALKLMAKSEAQIIKQAIPYDTGTICVEYALVLANAGKKDEAKEKFKTAITHYKEASSMDMAENAEKLMNKI